MVQLKEVFGELLLPQPQRSDGGTKAVTVSITPEQVLRLNACVQMAIFKEAGRLRDEAYWQVMKHLYSNPAQSSVERAWKLLCCLTAAFPPSKLLEPFLKEVLMQAAGRFDSAFKDSYYEAASSNLWMFSITGPRGYSPTPFDIRFWYERITKVPRLFGATLESICASPELLDEEGGHSGLPRILLQLKEMILALGGKEREGIFRVSGDLQQVFQLRTLLSIPGVRIAFAELNSVKSAIIISDDDNATEIESASAVSAECTTDVLHSGSSLIIYDPAVPCSVLKLWLRLLKHPLIPDPIYTRLLSSLSDPTRVSLLIRESLPRANYDVLRFVVRLLLEMAEGVERTLMDLKNFGMIFAPCLMRMEIGELGGGDGDELEAEAYANAEAEAKVGSSSFPSINTATSVAAVEHENVSVDSIVIARQVMKQSLLEQELLSQLFTIFAKEE